MIDNYSMDGVAKILADVRVNNPGFVKEEFLEYIKHSLIKLYNGIRENDLTNVPAQVEGNLINKLIQNKELYRLNGDIDTISIQFLDLKDFIKNPEGNYIKVYVSIYFYDDVSNNEENRLDSDKYWNDAWIVTVTEADRLSNSNCPNCGAIMKYVQDKDILECEYCQNKIHYPLKAKWKIVDIEVK